MVVRADMALIAAFLFLVGFILELLSRSHYALLCLFAGLFFMALALPIGFYLPRFVSGRQ
jgi:hypothetical protein